MTRLIHASIPADNPREVAEFIATLMEGDAMPFPPGGPQAWTAMSADSATQLEVVARGDLLLYGPEEAEWQTSAASQQRSEVHIALATPLTADRVLELAARHGWPARLCQRGGGLFELVEVWLEGKFLMELFDPGQDAAFAKAVSRESWKAQVEPA